MKSDSGQRLLIQNHESGKEPRIKTTGVAAAGEYSESFSSFVVETVVWISLYRIFVEKEKTKNRVHLILWC